MNTFGSLLGLLIVIVILFAPKTCQANETDYPCIFKECKQKYTLERINELEKYYLQIHDTIGQAYVAAVKIQKPNYPYSERLQNFKNLITWKNHIRRHSERNYYYTLLILCWALSTNSAQTKYSALKSIEMCDSVYCYAFQKGLSDMCTDAYLHKVYLHDLIGKPIAIDEIMIEINRINPTEEPQNPSFYLILGTKFLQKKNYKEAIKYFEKALFRSQKWNHIYNTLLVNELFLAHAHRLQRKLSVAQRYLDLSLKHAYEHINTDIDLQRWCHKEFALFYEQTDSLNKAVYHWKIHEERVKELDRLRKRQTDFIDLSIESIEKDLKKEKDLLYYKQKIILAEQQKKILSIIVFSLGVLIILITIIFLYRLYQKRQLTEIKKNFEANITQLESFNYILSHELKQHLFNIEHNLEKSILEHSFTAIDHIRQRIGYLNETISRIFELSKVDFQSSNRSLFSVNELIEEILDEKEAKLIKELQKDSLPYLNADRLLWKCVFSNLIDNSIKYRSPNISLSISITGERTENGYNIMIKDNGMGFPDSFNTEIFTPFRRSTHTQGIEGTGIGLIVVKKIIEKYKGTINASSTEGGGATFTIWIPQSLIAFDR